MKEYIRWMDDNPRIIKLLLCIWILDITWAVYRIGGAVIRKDWFVFVLAILWVIAAGTIGWILDIVWILVFNHIFWFED